MRSVLVVFALLGACKDPNTSHGEGSSAVTTHSGSSATGSAGAASATSGSAANGSASADDPWNKAPVVSADEPPSLTERVALANKLCPTVTGPYFFEIAKDGKVSHILGTRHVGVGLAKFPPVVRSTLASAKLAVFEVAPDDHSGKTSAEVALREKLGEKDWKHFRELVGSDTATALEHGAPATAAVSMLVMYEDVSNMLDKQIEDTVTDAKIPARGLETAAFQDGVLDELLDFRMLRATIEQTKDRQELEKESGDDLKQYCAGTDEDPGMDEDSKTKMKKAGYTDAEIAAVDEKLVFARNRDWIPKLEKIFKQGDVFVAVGADHLIGSRGVVALLQARGFKVTRITK